MDSGEFKILDDNQNVISTSKNAPVLIEARSLTATAAASTESLEATAALNEATSTPKSDAKEANIKKISLSCESDLSFLDHKKQTGKIFPTGRKPLLRVPGFIYGLNDSFVHCFSEENIHDISDDKIESKIRRYETYQCDSFICENGYLSENEIQTTPECDWKKKRTLIVKSKNVSEKKRWKMKLNLASCPEILTPGKGRKKPLKKWDAIVFNSGPIQTGVSVARAMGLIKPDQPQDQGFLNLNLAEDDRQDAFIIVQKAMHGSETASKMNVENPNSTTSTNSTSSTSSTTCTNTTASTSSTTCTNTTASTSSTTCTNTTASTTSTNSTNSINSTIRNESKVAEDVVNVQEYNSIQSTGAPTEDWNMKYKVKYIIKEHAKQLMDGENGEMRTPENLHHNILQLEPELSSLPQHIVNKYIQKYFHKFLNK